MMTPDRYRLFGWLASGLCLAISAGLIVSRHAALVAATAEESHAGADLAKASEAEAAVAHKANDRSFTCAPRATSEETAFITDLRRRARQCGVSISRWSSHATEYTNKDGAADPDKKALEGVTKVNCDLALTGSFASLRAFLADVWSSDRLLNVSHVDWSRAETGSELSLSLGRYLAPSTAESGAAAPKDAPKS